MRVYYWEVVCSSVVDRPILNRYSTFRMRVSTGPLHVYALKIEAQMFTLYLSLKLDDAYLTKPRA